ncbi:hypothetical protein B0H12DRAFT_1157072 [Mycena haematopus]|nr:hypothetical protein B0H12DRAFT_1157072 [Mycena haematopus]
MDAFPSHALARPSCSIGEKDCVRSNDLALHAPCRGSGYRWCHCHHARCSCNRG